MYSSLMRCTLFPPVVAILHILFACVGMLLVGGAAEPKGEPMKFKVAELSEEETKSEVIPEEFRCDACRAVIHHLTLALNRVKPKDLKQLAETSGKGAVQEHAAHLATELEKACDKSAYSDYGIKNDMHDKQKALHGPGIERDFPGAIQGGGKWANRLAARCSSLVEEVEEDDRSLSEFWRSGSMQKLCDTDCGRRKKTEPRPRRRPTRSPTRRPSSPPAKKEQRIEKALTGLEHLPPPPHSCKVLTRENFTIVHETVAKKGKKKGKFAMVLFHDTVPLSARVVEVFELTARKAKAEKDKTIRQTFFGRYFSQDGDTHGYPFKRMPAILLFRPGYKNPKIFDGGMDGPDQIVDWMKHYLAHEYMKDDPEQNPRTEL